MPNEDELLNEQEEEQPDTPTTPTLLDKVKIAVRRTATNAFDTDLTGLIDAALADLTIAGVDATASDDPLIVRAVCTYCRANFGTPPNYAELKASYDEQKAQLRMSGSYTNYADYGITSALDARGV